MTRIAFAADLHVDDYGSRRDAATGLNARFVDILGTVAWTARTARERGAQALVVAGDYTESKQPARAARVVKIAAALAEGPERQIHVQGNHDRGWAGESIVTDLARTPGWSGYMAPDYGLVDDVAICAIPFLDRAWWRAQPGNEMKPESVAFRELAEAYVTIAAGLHAKAIAEGAAATILVGHQQLAGGRMTEQQQSFLGDQDLIVDPRLLASIGYSAAIFGHVHRGQVVLDDPACPVLFAGSIERVDFAEEHEEKSFLLVDVEPGRPVVIERIPTPARRFVTVRSPHHEDDYPDAVTDAVVRVIDLDPDYEVREVRSILESLGAFDVTEIRRRPVSGLEVAGGLSESLSAEAALDEYFADDPDREAIVERGRAILEEVG